MLPRSVAQFVWVCLKLPFACLVLFFSTAIVAGSGIRLNATALVLILAGWWLPVVVDMQEGQVNFLALLPLVAGLYFAQRETAHADVWAGALIGLGAAVKVTPIVFIASLFLWRRRWCVAFCGVVTIVACSLLVPAVFFGSGIPNLQWLRQWMGVMIVPYAMNGRIVYNDYSIRWQLRAASADSVSIIRGSSDAGLCIRLYERGPPQRACLCIRWSELRWLPYPLPLSYILIFLSQPSNLNSICYRLAPFPPSYSGFPHSRACTISSSSC